MFVLHPSLVVGLAGGAFALLVFLLGLVKSVPLAIILVAIALAATTVVIVLTYKGFQERYERAVDRKEIERKRLERRLDSLLRRSCAVEDGIAAEYAGWYGTVHTFYFASPRFAAAFEQANPGKCLRGGQIHH